MINASRLRPWAIGAVALSLSATACRMPRSVYGPTGDNVSAAPGGQSAAVYEVSMGTSKGGQVKVWSRGVVADVRDGAAASEAANRPRAFEVGFVIRNDSGVQITMEPLEVHLVLEDMPELRPRESRTLAVDAGKSGEFVLRYPLPGRFEQKKPDSYEVSWTIHFATASFHQVTAFTRQTERGFVPKPLDSSAPADRAIIDGSHQSQPVGIPFGSDPSR